MPHCHFFSMSVSTNPCWPNGWTLELLHRVLPGSSDSFASTASRPAFESDLARVPRIEILQEAAKPRLHQHAVRVLRDPQSTS